MNLTEIRAYYPVPLEQKVTEMINNGFRPSEIQDELGLNRSQYCQLMQTKNKIPKWSGSPLSMRNIYKALAPDICWSTFHKRISAGMTPEQAVAGPKANVQP
jgi:hypothetical protein